MAYQNTQTLKSIPCYEGAYSISKKGDVYSHITGKFLKTQFLGKQNKVAYLSVKLQGKRHTIHRLVSNTFIPNPFKLAEVNHKNGIKTDNTVENLEWVSHQENINHSKMSGLYQKRTTSKLNHANIQDLRKMAFDKPQRDIAKIFGISQSMVSQIINGNRWNYV